MNISNLSIFFAQAGSDEVITAQVNWLEEIINGGATSVALILLFMFAIAIAAERLINLRSSRFYTKSFIDKIKKLNSEEKWDEISALCKQDKSILSRIIKYLLEHSNAAPELLIDGAYEISSRAIRKENNINFFLAVIASLAPLLGLLGTMIGMIESFKLVEIYGDEGGASMLAGSISKALITTAIGLIIAIISLVIYHWNKHRINQVSHQLEEEIERLTNHWFLR